MYQFFGRARLYYGLRLFAQHRWALLFVVTLMLLETAASLSIPMFAGSYTEQLVQQQAGFDRRQLLLVGLLFVLFVLQAILRYNSTFQVNLLGARIMAQLSCMLYDHLQALPLQYFADNKRGDVLSMLTNDLAIVSFFVSSVLTNLIPNLLVITGAAFMMGLIEPVIALLICVLIPTIFIVLKLVSRGMQPISQALVQSQADSIALASENLNAISLIKAFNKESSESERFKIRNSEILTLRKRQFKLQALLAPLVQLMASVAVLLIAIAVFVQYQDGHLDIPDMITLFLYGLLITRPLGALAALYGQVQQVIGATERLMRAYHLEAEPSYEGNKHLTLPSAEIRFTNVCFAFPERPLLLKDASFYLPDKHSLLIYGENGSGKTTLLNLLMRFYEAQQGDIFVGGHNIKQLSNSALRGAIGLVSQDVLLVNGSIQQNITYGVNAPTEEQILCAAKQSGAHTFISNLPAGYQTQIGENGVKLSGGQKQRISLARALLLQPRILLLDEPTSMLDESACNSFREEFSDLFAHFTVIMISHDMRLASAADQVLCLQKGQLIATSSESIIK